jgi:hypothetical protein
MLCASPCLSSSLTRLSSSDHEGSSSIGQWGRSLSLLLQPAAHPSNALSDLLPVFCFECCATGSIVPHRILGDAACVYLATGARTLSSGTRNFSGVELFRIHRVWLALQAWGRSLLLYPFSPLPSFTVQLPVSSLSQKHEP